MFDHLAADSRQPPKAGSELHFDMDSRSGFRYRSTARYKWVSALAMPGVPSAPALA
jgi:hypothetical protein